METRRRGRPPQYDRDAALAALTNAFWDQGLSATSLDALAAAAGMNRPSLYAAFGDKQAMYLDVLARFGEQACANVRLAMAAGDTPRTAVTALLRGGVKAYLAGPNGPRGCLAVCTATSEAVMTPAVREALQLVLRALDAAVAERLAELGSPEPALQGQMVAAMLHSLAVRARAGAGEAELLALADAAAARLA
jgi:AcrR family transcriptional regulator